MSSLLRDVGSRRGLVFEGLCDAGKLATIDALEVNIRFVFVGIWPKLLLKVIENCSCRLKFIRLSGTFYFFLESKCAEKAPFIFKCYAMYIMHLVSLANKFMCIFLLVSSSAYRHSYLARRF